MLHHLQKHKRRYLLAWIITLGLWARGAYHYVEQTSHPHIYQTLADVPTDQTILLLGTSPTLADGRGNLFYIYRIQAVVDLRKVGKISHILISGDNRHHDYNEPEAMQQSLIDAGIPANIIELDYAWFRTLDSVVRARDVFGQDDLLVVSQTFHIKRAITIGRQKSIQTTGYAARDVSTRIAPRVYLREILARMWMTLDLYILHTKPHFPS